MSHKDHPLPPSKKERELDTIIKEARKNFPDVINRFVFHSTNFLGTKYVCGPLGEGIRGKIDKDPLYDFDKVDCVTFIEQSLALTISKSYKDFLPNLNKIRYKNGKISYLTRNHYSVPDWLLNNKWVVSDATEEIGSKNVKYLTRTIDKQKFFNKAGLKIAMKPVCMKTSYIPKKNIKNIRDKLKAGLIIFHIGKKTGIFTLHWGILVKDYKNNKFLIRHASSVKKKVVDEDFFKYLKKYKFIKGLKFLKLKKPEKPGSDSGF